MALRWVQRRTKSKSPGSALEKLLSIASPALCDPLPHLPSDLLDNAGDLGPSLLALLRRKNGFIAFESALHLFPAGPVDRGYDLVAWNRADLWRDSYEDLSAGFLFFAEDLFGDQFALRAGRVYRFAADTGRATEWSDDLEGWTRRLLADYRVETAWPLAHAWQTLHGPLGPGERLVPRLLFALGGEYSVDNLVNEDAAEAMRFRGGIAVQTRDLPNGTKMRLRVAE